MPRRFASSAGFRTMTALCRRLGAGLGVLALALQLLVPLNAVQAAPWLADGLFPPTCSVHAEAADPGDPDQCQQCPLCQGQASVRFAAPVLAAVVLRDRAAVIALPVLRRDDPAAPDTHPPLPSRGPPAA